MLAPAGAREARTVGPGAGSRRGRPTRAVRMVWPLSHHSLSAAGAARVPSRPVRPTHLVLGSPAANAADRLRKRWVVAFSRPPRPTPRIPTPVGPLNGNHRPVVVMS